MKYIVVLGDGMADYHRGVLGNKTPLELAKKPNIDGLAKKGLVGTIKTIDEGQKPGSDVANLSVIGYDPRKYYTGRSPLEALSIGIDVQPEDTVFRVNLVTLGDEADFENKTMIDYSAGEISTQEGHELMTAVDEALGIKGSMEFFGGTSYRNCAVLRNAHAVTAFTPPHDILDQVIGNYLPSGEGKEVFIDLTQKSMEILANHPINLKRIAEGKNPANAIWFWGRGTKPLLPSFYELYGLKGAVISAVDLLKGIAVGAQMEVIEVEGATGTYKSNFIGKAKAAVEALKTNDYVYIHMEAPDECGHQGDAEHKILSIELIDGVVKYIADALTAEGVDFCMAILPDHATPLVLRTHVSDPVPFVVYNSLRPAMSGLTYTEKEGEKGVFFDNGRALLQYMMKS